MGSPFSFLLLSLIKIYRFVFAYKVPTCRYLPTCSQYAMEAIEEWGALKGFYLSVKRLLRCHPFAKGGVDLVPKKGNEHVKW